MIQAVNYVFTVSLNHLDREESAVYVKTLTLCQITNKFACEAEQRPKPSPSHAPQRPQCNEAIHTLWEQISKTLRPTNILHICIH